MIRILKKHSSFNKLILQSVISLLLSMPYVSFAQKINREKFYANCSKEFSKEITTRKARIIIDKIFDYWELKGYTDQRWLAYILGTAYRESAKTMTPIREVRGCTDDACSIRGITKYIDKKMIQ